MEEDVKTLKERLEEELSRQLEELALIHAGTDEQRKAIANLETLYRLKLEEDKLDVTYNSELKKSEIEEKKLELAKIEEEKKETTTNKDRLVKIGLEVTGLVLPLLFYGRWMRAGFKFEETGSFASATFRNLFGHFRPTRLK